jgi:2-amino-4-hydroxy-6-hydroxymethyldihydropteridine diphosphokinase
MHSGFLLTGSNLGNRYANMQECRTQIGKILNILNVSRIYKSASWGIKDQPEFFNQVIQFQTRQKATELLLQTQKIELEMGRERKKKWGSRLIDIDILYFGEQVIQLKNLVVPHPEIQNRRFTLIPLVEIAADFVHPILKKTNSDLLKECKDPLRVWIDDQTIDETSASR